MSWVALESIVFASQQLGTFFAFSKVWRRFGRVLWTKTYWLIRTSIINSSRSRKSLIEKKVKKISRESVLRRNLSFFFFCVLVDGCASCVGWKKKKKNSSANWAYVGHKSLACNFVFHGDLWLQLNVWVSKGNSMVSRDFSKNTASDIWNSPKYHEHHSGELSMEALSWRTGWTGRMWESHANARSYGGLCKQKTSCQIGKAINNIFSDKVGLFSCREKTTSCESCARRDKSEHFSCIDIAKFHHFW